MKFAQVKNPTIFADKKDFVVADDLPHCTAKAVGRNLTDG
jgi:hypothetical protein